MPGKSKDEARSRLAVWPAALLLVARAALAGGAESGAAAAIADTLQKSYEATPDFVAGFLQETEVKTLNRSLKARGRVSFKRPGKMLWLYQEPQGQFVLADGDHLYFYQPEQNQVIKTPLKSAFRSDIPLSFLLGIGNLKRDFTVTLKATEESQHVLRLQPKGEARGFSEILLGVNRAATEILWASIRDAAGNLTTVRFSDIRKGVGVKDSLFRFQIPAGADLVELGHGSQ
ncbi:MAG TPA: outer membrane lipoprotein carrier protein LolA [candidate division Zixibacteria bacterium]|nr:outer membrane lipoprotein carrier protein LolA [candidate division Zixibacteria bacterium]